MFIDDSFMRRLAKAIDGVDDWDPFGDVEEQEWGSDPVSRITEPAGQPEAGPVRPLDTPEEIDAMTTSRPERKQAEETFAKQTPGSSAAFQAAEAATGLQKMTTGDFTLKMLAKEGTEYEWGGTTRKTGWDCSGIIYRIMVNAGFGNFPRTSGEIYAHSKKIPLKKAIKTRGAILWTEGHIAVSLGNGKTIEAMGEDYGVVKGNAEGRFTGGGLLPELKLGKTMRRQKNPRMVRQVVKAEPASYEPTVDSLISAATVFGSVLGEVEGPSPKTLKEWDGNRESGGLGFVPKRFRNLFKEAGDVYGLSPRLLAFVAQKESGFDPKADSKLAVDPALGIMQVRAEMHGLKNPFNARANIMKGAEILSSYMAGLGLRDGLAAYNAGPGNAPGQSGRSPEAWAQGLAYADEILDALLGRQVA